MFRVKEVLAQTKPELFKLKDLLDDEVPGFFYKEQLRKTGPADESRAFEVEKVLKTKTEKKKKWYLCKFLFYPAKFNQWIPEENMVAGAE